MASKFSKFAATLALGSAFLVTPALLDPANPFAIDSAFAGKGGNGNGGGNGGGNGNGNGGSAKASGSHGNSGNKVAKVAKAEKATKVNHGATASKLGALNAAHASATAFANASPNSRVGRIAAYGQASAAAVESGEALLAAQDQLASLNETVTNYNTALEDVTAAEGKLAEDAPALQAIVDDLSATTEAKAAAAAELQGLNDAVDAAQTTADSLQAAADAAAAQIPDAEATVAQAEIDAEAAEAAAQEALNSAANKTPVSDETKAALDALLVGKITEAAIEQ
jgi:hypothetical protein